MVGNAASSSAGCFCCPLRCFSASFLLRKQRCSLTPCEDSVGQDSVPLAIRCWPLAPRRNDAAKPRDIIVESKPAVRFCCPPSRSGSSMLRSAVFVQFLSLPLCWLPSARAAGALLARHAPQPAHNRHAVSSASVVAGNFKCFGPRNYPGIRAFIWFSCHFPGGGEFSGSLRAGNRHRKHRLVLCRLGDDEPPRSS